MALALPVLAAPAAGAQANPQLSPGQALLLTAPDVALSPPADGALNSYGVDVHVEGLAFGSEANTASGTVTAAPGTQLVVLHVVTSWQRGDVDESVPWTSQVSLSLDSGNLSAPLTVNGGDYPSPDEEYYAAAIPTSGPAVLSLSVAGLLPQRLDLRTDRRVGTAPAVLYRAGYQPAVDVTSSASENFTGSTSLGAATGQFGVAEAFLSYWQPFSTTTASAPSQAYLDVQFAHSKLSLGGAYSGDEVDPAGPLRASAVTFQLPDGQTVHASVANNSIDTDLFTGDFYAQVPAGIASVKVIVAPGTLPIQVNTDAISNEPTNLTFSSPLTTTVTFPPIWTPPSRTAPHGSAPATRAGAAATKHRSGSSGRGAIIAAAVVVLVAGLGLVFARRRRRFVAARPLVWPPTALSPASTRLLTAPLGRALPPAGDREGHRPPETPLELGPVITNGPAAPHGGRTAPAGPKVMIRLLGPLDVEGLVRPIRRNPVWRLLVILAVTPERPLGTDEVAMAISNSSQRDPKAASVNSYASNLRSSLPPGVLPDATVDGYHLEHSAVTVDWLVLAAVAAEPSGRPEWENRAAAALELVRGRPLAGRAWEGVEPAVRQMQATVEGLARTLAAQRVASADAAGAEWAAGKGLEAVPGSVGLWEDRLDAAAAGSGYGLERAWGDCRAALKADAALLAAHYQQLRRTIAQRPSADV